jgi:hypothetical protein
MDKLFRQTPVMRGGECALEYLIAPAAQIMTTTVPLDYGQAQCHLAPGTEQEALLMTTQAGMGGNITNNLFKHLAVVFIVL